MGELKSPGKSFEISKQEVWEAFQKVKANKGAPGWTGGARGVRVRSEEQSLSRSGTGCPRAVYFPPPVQAVEIPKPHGGGTRILGVPTVADRIAQTVVARRMEARVEPIFHPDSYGYRPGRSALDAVAACRERCWRYDWVIDLDVQKFFDSVPWDLVVKAVEAHTDQPWVLLYVKRWLAAPLQLPDGTLAERDRGTPQGSAVSPVLANLFMHYAFDPWIAKHFPASRSSAMPTTPSCTAPPSGKPSNAGGDRKQDGRGRAATAPGQDPDRVLQGRQAARLVTSTRRSPSWGSRSVPEGHRARTGRCSPRSCPQSARTPLTR